LGLMLLAYLVRRYRRDPESLRLWQQPALASGAGAADLPPAAAPARVRTGGKRRKRR
jgi:hypothetical protein